MLAETLLKTGMLFHVRELIRMVAEYADQLYAQLPMLSPQQKALPDKMLESKTWGELCCNVPIGSIGLMTIGQKEAAFIVLDKPYHASNGTLNVAFLPMDDRHDNLLKDAPKSLRDLSEGSSSGSYYPHGKKALLHEIWLNPVLKTTYSYFSRTDEMCESNGIYQRIRFVNPEGFRNHIGGFIAFLLTFRSYPNALEWAQNIRQELDCQRTK